MKKANGLLSVKEAAEAKGISINGVYLAISSGRLKAYRTKQPILIRRRDLDAWEVVGHRPKKTNDKA